MDIDYLPGREQVSLARAAAAASPEARIAHRGLARGYGALLAASRYPHRSAPPRVLALAGPGETRDRGHAGA